MEENNQNDNQNAKETYKKLLKATNEGKEIEFLKSLTTQELEELGNYVETFAVPELLDLIATVIYSRRY